MKNIPSESWWWAYWNNDNLKNAIQGEFNKNYYGVVKYILLEYENYLLSQGKSGYHLIRANDIENLQLEHIAPQTPTKGEVIATGYPEYDEDFKNKYLDCLGNYLLASQSHNASIGNKAFQEKLQSYDYLAQQREIKEMTKESLIWEETLIKQRKEKLVNFILSTF